jgi:hypothetical protein
MNYDWSVVGVKGMVTAIEAMRMCIKERGESFDKIKKMIEKRSKEATSVNEVALWETYKDFLDPRINQSLDS